MKYLVLIPLIYTYSCSAFTPVADDIEKMADDNAITIKINKEAMSKDTNVHVDVLNHEEELQKP